MEGHVAWALAGGGVAAQAEEPENRQPLRRRLRRETEEDDLVRVPQTAQTRR